MKLTAKEASEKLEAKLIGDPNFLIEGVNDPKLALSSQVCFAAYEKYLDLSEQVLQSAAYLSFSKSRRSS